MKKCIGVLANEKITYIAKLIKSFLFFFTILICLGFSLLHRNVIPLPIYIFVETVVCTWTSRKKISYHSQLHVCIFENFIQIDQLHLHATQALGRYPCAELEGILAGRPIVSFRAFITCRLRVFVEVDDEVAITHQRCQTHVLLFYSRTHQHLQREKVLVVRLRQVTVHEVRQPVTSHIWMHHLYYLQINKILIKTVYRATQ